MTTLTPNRLLQKGDEYRDNGAWKPVPKDDFGLQVMFTKYAEVRRPSETISPRPAAAGPSKDSRPLPTARKAETSEGAKREASASTVSSPASDKPDRHAPRGGETISKIDTGAAVKAELERRAQSEREIEANGLPTVVSAKAHKRVTIDPTKAPLPHLPVTPPPVCEIKFPTGSPKTIWTGRNGTFNSLGVELQRKSGTDICAIVPQGKRGTAKNAIIEFPVSAIPQIVDFLTHQYIETLPK